MTITVIARKWGNSLGVTLPKELVTRQKIKDGDVLSLPIVIKKADLTDVFGIAKTKENAQKFKDRLKKGWKDA